MFAARSWGVCVADDPGGLHSDYVSVDDYDAMVEHLSRSAVATWQRVFSVVKRWTKDTPEYYAQRNVDERRAYELWVEIKQLIERESAGVTPPQENHDGKES